MFERQHDAMGCVRKFGRPDVFTTVTTNPKWPEILESLTPAQQPHDLADLLVRVFLSENPKLFEDFERWLLQLLEGPSIEFQKRSLPHAYILLWLSHDAEFYLCNYFYHLICVHCSKNPKLYLYNFFTIIFL